MRERTRPPVEIRFAELQAWREAKESWSAIQARLGGISMTAIRACWRSGTDRVVLPRVRRKAAQVQAPAGSEPERIVRSLAGRLLRAGVKHIEIDTERGSARVLRLETYDL